MRKIVSFLTLIMIVTMLPGKVKAWDFSGGSNPLKVEIKLNAPYNRDLPMTFGNGTWSSAVFTATGSDLQFKMRPYYSSDGSFEIGNSNYSASPSGGWTTASTNGNDNWYALTGLCPGTTYKIEFTEDGVADNDTFRFRVTEVHNKMYLYDTDLNLIGEASNADGVFTFSADINAGKYFVMSSNARTDGWDWDKLQANGGRFNPDNADIDVPGEATGFAGGVTSGAWKATRSGRYKITADFNSFRLSANCDMSLYSTPWATLKGTATPNADGIYEYDLTLNAGEYILLSEKNDGATWDDINGSNWTPDVDGDMVSGMTCKISKKESGAWRVPRTGRYKITVNWVNKEFTAFRDETIPAGVHLPLTSKDFEGGRKHYFIVGERMGEWHLQPEWELKERNGEYVLNNRFIYPGAFAVGVVDNFYDYINHTFTYYCKGCEFIGNALSCDGISGTGRLYEREKGETRFNPDEVFYFIDDKKDYYESRGLFASEIKVRLDGAGRPASISLTKGSVEEATKQRVFTLVGDNIINTRFNNQSGHGTTTMHNRGFDGWFDSWIQYDPSDQKPYVDGRGEYLYHTSYTPDYLTANPVYFNLNLDNGSEFAYTSGEVQFVEWRNLPNLDSDPYKDFYKSISGKEKITATPVQKSGNGYNYTLNVECDNPETQPTADWSCYVIRDMWIGGDIKFWTGWGGNVDKTNNGEFNLAVWHGPNGGPDIAADGRQQVKGYDVNANNLNVSIYKNVRARGNTNYKVSDGKPVYFNRVVLWYNNTDGVNNSYLQFIQESSGPAILAETMMNESYQKKNYINYHWYLNPSQNETDADKKVVSYEITRYRLVDNIPQKIGYPEGQTVYIKDVCDHDVYVRNLFEGVAPEQAFTIHTDKGITGDTGFSPGIYEYDIWVNLEDGTRKKAVSNPVAIYDDSLVTPNVVVLQLVELRDEYTDNYPSKDADETTHQSGKEYLGVTQKYLTYRDADNKNYYVLDMTTKEVTVDGRTMQVSVPVNARIIDSGKASEFLRNHPDKYLWTSDYYVRCLDYNSYAHTMQGYIDSKLMLDTEVPEPTLVINEKIRYNDAQGNEQVATELRGKAERFDFDGKIYYSAIVTRGGNLSDGTFEVKLSYSYTDAENKLKTPSTQAAADFDPLVPRPYNPIYRYEYSRPSTSMEHQWGKISVPVTNWNTNLTSTADHLNTEGAMGDVYVKFDEYFDPRNFTLLVDFNRPNVNKEIYKYYDIRYDLKIENNVKDGFAVPLDINAVVHDTKLADADFEKRYRMEIKGLHPSNNVNPVVTFVKTEYVPNTATDSYGMTYKTQTGTINDRPVIDAVHKVDVTEGSGLNNVQLGKIKRDNGWDWLYKGHQDFDDNNENLVYGDNKYEHPRSGAAITPLYYLIELKNDMGDKATYEYLVPHAKNHNDGNFDIDKETGLVKNDKDPLIGTYIAKGFKSEDTPTVYATAIYIFERPVNGNDATAAVEFNGLDKISFTNNAARANKTAPARLKKDNTTNSDLANGNAGDLPDTKVAPEGSVLDMNAADSVTGYNKYVAVKGMTYRYTPGEDNVTGVDDVLAGYDDSEVIYFNLQGMRIEEPTAAGVYLVKQGKTVKKIFLK